MLSACLHTPISFPPIFQGKCKDADLLYVRVLEILGATFGEEHPDYATALNNRALLLKQQVRAVRTFQKTCGGEYLMAWLLRKCSTAFLVLATFLLYFSMLF